MLSNNEQHEAKQRLPPSIPHLTSHEGKKANKNEHIAWDSSANSMKGILKIADHTRFDKCSILDIVWYCIDSVWICVPCLPNICHSITRHIWEGDQLFFKTSSFLSEAAGLPARLDSARILNQATSSSKQIYGMNFHRISTESATRTASMPVGLKVAKNRLEICIMENLQQKWQKKSRTLHFLGQCPVHTMLFCRRLVMHLKLPCNVGSQSKLVHKIPGCLSCVAHHLFDFVCISLVQKGLVSKCVKYRMLTEKTTRSQAHLLILQLILYLLIFLHPFAIFWC